MIRHCYECKHECVCVCVCMHTSLMANSLALKNSVKGMFPNVFEVTSEFLKNTKGLNVLFGVQVNCVLSD